MDICIFWMKLMETIVCDLELLSFMRVAAMDLLFDPYSIFFWIFSYESTLYF